MDKENTQKSVDDKESKNIDSELLKVNNSKFRNKERKPKKKRNKLNSTQKPKKN
jgi:hypothetical protein